MKNINRRDFVNQSGKVIAAAGIVGLAPKNFSNDKSMLNSFVHHVFFWLKEPGNGESVKRFEAALKELVTIESIQHFHLGKPAETRREIIDSSYHYSLLVFFEDKKSHDIYQEHPKHDIFRKVNGELSAKVLIYDSIAI